MVVAAGGTSGLVWNGSRRCPLFGLVWQQVVPLVWFGVAAGGALVWLGVAASGAPGLFWCGRRRCPWFGLVWQQAVPLVWFGVMAGGCLGLASFSNNWRTMFVLV